MDRQELEELLEGLPETELRLLAAVRALEKRNMAGTARDLLTRAVAKGAGELSRIELSRRLLDRGRASAVLKELREFETTSVELKYSAYLLRALALSELGRDEQAGEEIDRAAEDGLSEEIINDWRNHLFGDGALPQLPFYLDTPIDDEATEPGARHLNPDFSDDEPTHLLSVDDEPTTLRPHPAPSLRDDATTGIRFTDPTLPGEADMAGERRRYMSNPGQPAAQPVAPSSDGPQEFELSQGDLEFELELDMPDPRGEAAPRAEIGSMRRLSGIVKTRAQTHLADALQSPLRALLIAATTALVILVIGISLIYSSLANSHIDRQLSSVHRAVDADLYSSHRAALRILEEVPNHQVLPFESLDSAVLRMVEAVPGLSVTKRVDELGQLQTYVQARMAFRFDPLAVNQLEISAEGDSPLLNAARIYMHLARGEFDTALGLADMEVPGTWLDHFIILAHADALVAAGATELFEPLVETFPQATPAEAYLRALMMLQLDEAEGIEYLRQLVDGSYESHVGMRLELASRIDDFSQARSLVDDFRDPNHAHASPIERSRAHLIRAQFFHRQGDDGGRHRELRAASDAAPLYPPANQPLIEVLLHQGELHEARTHLARLPTNDNRHPYFDSALARVHLAIGDVDRAVSRLEAHALADPEATALLAVAHGMSGDLNQATALIDAVLEVEHPSGMPAHAWLRANLGDFDGASQALDAVDAVDAASLEPFFHALYVDAYRLTAGLARSRADRITYLGRAGELLDSVDEEGPESRRVACLVALDGRNASLSEERCRRLSQRDFMARPAASAVVRWHLFEDRIDDARQVIERVVAASGPATAMDLLLARLAIVEGDFDGARQILDETPAQLRYSPDHLLVEGRYALALGRLERAQRNFREAQQASDLYRPEAILGLIEAELAATGLNESNEVDEVDGVFEDHLRNALRHGEFGAYAWTLFASFRRHQGRMNDAVENIEFAMQARNDFGPSSEEIHILTERIAIGEARGGPGNSSLDYLIETAVELGANTWQFHLLASNWHAHQDRPDTNARNRHLRSALGLAPELCQIWEQVDDIDSRRDRNQISARIARPDACR